MFLGEHQHTLDAKGRVSLPARFRSQMTGNVVICQGLDTCLYVYPADEYTTFVKTLTEGSDFNAAKREMRRFFTIGAREIELDSAGRVSVPAHLRTFAGLDKDVVVAGNGDRIEIWDAERWAAYSGQTAERIEDLAQELADAGLL